ncbi:MAG: hypothetical protein MI923_26470 [Phycisphaerales bacterium]|nr:hypothetical protein [Phycisphaerales bacterium]
MNQLDATRRETTREHVAALEVFRVAKNAFFWLAFIAVVLHLASWLVVQYGDKAEFSSASSLVSDQAGMEGDAAQRWVERMESSLVVAGFVAFAAVLVVLGAFVMSMLISLSARLGGAASLAKACVWSLAALALVMPWIRIDPTELDEFHSTVESVLSVVRFALCPLLVIVFLLFGQIHFRRAHRRITIAPAAKLPIHEV